jgi:5-methylcytosine-specific restriction enzyme subunit McrC
MGQRAVTLFEHQYISYERLGIIAQKTSQQAVLDELERLNTSAGREILRLERKGLRAGSVVGVLRVGDLNIQILPKIDYPIDRDGLITCASFPEESAAHNLLTMLSYAYDLPLIEQDLVDVDIRGARWFDLLTRLFVAQLHRQALSGLSQGYLTTRAVLPVMRGRWDVQRQIQHSGQPRHTFDVIFDEYSVDIPLNQIFRFVLEKIYPLTSDPQTRQMVDELRRWFDPVTLLPQIETSLVDSIVFNRLNERFHAAFSMARLFLSGEIIQMTTGSLRACAFLLEMNALFEQFTAAFIERHRKAILPPGWQQATIHRQSKGINLYLAQSESNNILRLRPDLLLTLPGQTDPQLVADTKYKLLNPVQPGLGADAVDFYQMLAYAVRLKCPRGLLIYPQAAGSHPLLRHFMVKSAEFCVTIATINLHARLDSPGNLIEELRGIFKFVISDPQ